MMGIPGPAAPASARDRFVLARRPSRPAHDPWRHQGVIVEDERTADGHVARVATVLLTGRECPWRCVMCDLWTHTIADDTPRGALVRQIDDALEALARDGTPTAQIKLYNAGSFFDPRAVPESDYDALAERVAAFSRVIVESHPALVGPRVTRFQSALARAAGNDPVPALEIAMGLETAHPDALHQLHKRFTLDEFRRAASEILRLGASLRVFLLVGVPFIPPAGQQEWIAKSVAFAFDCGASVVSLIPTRSGNGAVDALAAAGMFHAPSLADVETALERALPVATGRVFADLWDIRAFATCPACIEARRERLRRMNLEQQVQPPFACGCRDGVGDGPAEPHHRIADERGAGAGRDAAQPRPIPGAVNDESERPRRHIEHPRRHVTVSTDVAIIGSGFAGSLMALALRRMGRSVVLLERGRHPRFAIGESSTPLANLLIEELCDRYGLDRIRPLSKWGTWQREYPAIGCGLKRGFSFFRHDPGKPFHDDGGHARQLLVAASPHDEIGDTHWYRPDVDAFLAREAQAAGAEYLDEVTLTGIQSGVGGTVIDGTRHGQLLQVRARFVIDASGTRGFLHRRLGLPERPLTWLPPTHGLYTHFEGVRRFEQTADAGFDGPTPFSVDAAALHHVFPGGWIWVLRFANGITSAGAAVTDPLAASLRLGDEGGWTRLLQRLPSVQAQFADARATRPFVYAPRLAFRSAVVAGPDWALLPSAAGVIDPLLSTGFPLTLLGIQRLCAVFEQYQPGSPRFADALVEYGEHTLRELDATEQLVGALYAGMEDFERFKRLTLLYFAAASFAETMRRLNRPERVKGFLLCDDPQFGPELAACAAVSRGPLDEAGRTALFARIDRAIAPFDVAGLRDRSRRDWYPALAGDLLAAAPRLDVHPDEIGRLLERCGFSTSRETDAHIPVGQDSATAVGQDFSPALYDLQTQVAQGSATPVGQDFSPARGQTA